MRNLRALVDKMVPSGGAGERVIKSGVWALLLNLFNRFFLIVQLAAFAYVLGPTDFGVVGILLLLLSAIRQFTTVGIDDALIQREAKDVDEYLDTAFALKILRGSLAVAFIYLAAPGIVTLFGQPLTVDLVRVTAIAPLLLAVHNPGVVYFRKQLAFHREFVYQISNSITAFVFSLSILISLETVWAFPIGVVLGRFFQGITSYLIIDSRPGTRFSRSRAMEIIGFGKWIAVTSAVVFLVNEGDDALVGTLLGATSLGYYQFAYRFSNAPATEITNVINSVLFPAYSQVQTDVGQLRSVYLKALRLSTTVTFPASLGIFVVSPIFIRTFFGQQWSGAILPMQILALWGLLRSVGASSGPLFYAIGRPDLPAKIVFLRVIVIAIIIYPMTIRYGLVGTAFTIVITSACVSEPIGTYVATRQVNSTFKTVISTMVAPLIGSIGMAIILTILREQWESSEGVVVFSVLVIVGICVYAVTILFLELRFGFGYRELYRTIRRGLSD